MLRGRGERKLAGHLSLSFAAPRAGDGGRRKFYELLLETTATRGRQSTNIAHVWRLPGQTNMLQDVVGVWVGRISRTGPEQRGCLPGPSDSISQMPRLRKGDRGCLQFAMGAFPAWSCGPVAGQPNRLSAEYCSLFLQRQEPGPGNTCLDSGLQLLSCRPLCVLAPGKRG